MKLDDFLEAINFRSIKISVLIQLHYISAFIKSKVLEHWNVLLKFIRDDQRYHNWLIWECYTSNLNKCSLMFYQFTCMMKSKEFNHWIIKKEQTIDFVFVFSITHSLTIQKKNETNYRHSQFQNLNKITKTISSEIRQWMRSFYWTVFIN